MSRISSPSADRDKLRTILIVDDEPGVIDAVRETLCGLGHNLIATTDPHSALSMLKEHRVDLLITDVFVPQMDGGRLLSECRRIQPKLNVVVLTGLASDSEFRLWRRRGESIISKPWLDEEFIDVVANA